MNNKWYILNDNLCEDEKKYFFAFGYSEFLNDTTWIIYDTIRKTSYDIKKNLHSYRAGFLGNKIPEWIEIIA